MRNGQRSKRVVLNHFKYSPKVLKLSRRFETKTYPYLLRTVDLLQEGWYSGCAETLLNFLHSFLLWRELGKIRRNFRSALVVKNFIFLQLAYIGM